MTRCEIDDSRSELKEGGGRWEVDRHCRKDILGNRKA